MSLLAFMAATQARLAGVRPARLLLDGAGEHVEVGQLMAAWPGSYPLPAATLVLSFLPAVDEPATRQAILGSSSDTRGLRYLAQGTGGELIVCHATGASGARQGISGASLLQAGTEARMIISWSASNNLPLVMVNGGLVSLTASLPTDVGSKTAADEYYVGASARSGDASAAGGVRQFGWLYGVEMDATEMAALDGLLAADKHANVAALLDRFLPFLTSDDGADGGSIQDLAADLAGIPRNTEAGDLVAV